MALTGFLTELGQVLHEEHFRILSLICGLENRVAGGLASLLTQEHDTIGPLAERVRETASMILDRAIDAGCWGEFRSAANDLAGEMITRVQKEEMTVVPQRRAFLDTDTDHRLAEKQLAEKQLAERPPTRIRIALLPRWLLKWR